MLDVLVLIAMALIAAAFAAGLNVQAGLPLLPVLIAGAALFLVMAGSFLRLGKARASGGEGVAELQGALEDIDADLQRIDKVEDGLAGLHSLAERVDQLDQAIAASGPMAFAGGEPGAPRAAGDLEDVYARIEAVRDEVRAEGRSQRSKITADLGVLETLMKRLADDMTNSQPAGAATAAPAEPLSAFDEPPVEPEPAAEDPVSAEEEVILEEEVIVEEELIIEEELIAATEAPAEQEEPETAPAFEPEPAPEPEPVPEPTPAPVGGLVAALEMAAGQEAEPDTKSDVKSGDEDVVEMDLLEEIELADTDTGAAGEPEQLEPVTVEDPAVEDVDEEDIVAASAALLADEEAEEARILDVIRDGIRDGRVDVYLQPTVTLTDRKARYFEALTRIRTEGDELALPPEYMPVAKRFGLMPLIDNVLLVRSVQVLRRLGPDTHINGVFANVSTHSLLDTDYFPELIEFLEENSSLSENLIFEISHPELLSLTGSELGYLDTLGALGFQFCVDNVVDVDSDFSAMSDRYFRYVKISAEEFLGAPSRKASDLKRHLDGLSIQLIVEKVEDEKQIAELLDHDIDLARGYLFGAPKPMNAALSRELEGAGAS